MALFHSRISYRRQKIYWSEDEDAALRSLVENALSELGPGAHYDSLPWSSISKTLLDSFGFVRDAPNCKRRWSNNLCEQLIYLISQSVTVTFVILFFRSRHKKRSIFTRGGRYTSQGACRDGQSLVRYRQAFARKNGPASDGPLVRVYKALRFLKILLLLS